MPSTGTTGTTTTANQVVIGAVGTNQDNNMGTPGSSFTEAQERSSGQPDMISVYRIVSSTGAYECTIPFGSPLPPIYETAGVIITLKEESASVDVGASAFFLIFD